MLSLTGTQSYQLVTWNRLPLCGILYYDAMFRMPGYYDARIDSALRYFVLRTLPLLCGILPHGTLLHRAGCLGAGEGLLPACTDATMLAHNTGKKAASKLPV